MPLSPKTDESLKTAIFNLAKSNYNRKYAEKESNHPIVGGGTCLYQTACLIAAAHELAPGLRVIPQAGSAMFLRLPTEKDDGKDETMTHFSFMWQNEPIELIRKKYLACNILPEIHIWAAIAETQELIDFAVGDIDIQCVKIGRMDWLTPTPPTFIWAQRNGIPPGWHYEPTQEATMFAVQMLKEYILNQPEK